MTNPEIDPVDHHRTTRQHAGETMKNGTNAPGIVAIAIAVAVMVIGLAALANGSVLAGTGCLVSGVLIGAAGLTWLRRAHRQVRAAELHWHSAHSDAPAPPPSS
ncbi:hypothetical protein [Mycobacterium asiaticum]|uniref:UsfY protein n=1 Tax=Mycobacterium asiaticum TaxID=1790 RepID=A0A1A3NDG2_MYCAS|nr:hypothetical protein [Mycobacterium asiaticum]OBK19330.1 hypothetical protein A5636_18130 [Mycobacterium asiaticum]